MPDIIDGAIVYIVRGKGVIHEHPLMREADRGTMGEYSGAASSAWQSPQCVEERQRGPRPATVFIYTRQSSRALVWDGWTAPFTESALITSLVFLPSVVDQQSDSSGCLWISIENQYLAFSYSFSQGDWEVFPHRLCQSTLIVWSCLGRQLWCLLGPSNSVGHLHPK